VLTLNVAGIPFIQPFMSRRTDAIAGEIRKQDYDIVALQEVWRDAEAREIAEKAGLRYYVRVPRAVSIGTGLAILSRYPILEAHEEIFTCRPPALRVREGEGIAHKGVLMGRVSTPWGELDVYDTHLVADYPKTRYLTLRLAQIAELAEAVERGSRARPLVVLGDLNAAPDDPEYRVLVDLLGLDDACRSGGQDVCGNTDEEVRRRIDHILMPEGRGVISSAWRVFRGSIAKMKLRYSDHDGLAATFDARALLNRRSEPNLKRRQESLMHIDSAIGRMLEAMGRRLDHWILIPAYGLAARMRYQNQRERLEFVREKAETARILSLEGNHEFFRRGA
jgi:sphingomyelin phosphodiesterase 2